MISRSIKFFFIILALVLLALLAFVVTFDANNYKSQIIEQVEKATGRDFTIDGDINLSLFPWVGLKVEHAALGNEKGFKAEQFAAIKQLDIRVNVLPLLKKEVQINTIRLHGLNVSLEVAGDGSNNWSSLSQAEQSQVEVTGTITDEKKSEAVDKVAAEKEETTSSPLQSLKVEGFEFVDAEIHYDDSSSQTIATISELNLTTGAIEFDQAVAINFGARIESNQPAIDTRLKLTTQLTFNAALTEFSLHDFEFTVFAKANEFIAQDEQVVIKSNINVSMDAERVTLKQLQLSVLGTTTLADFSVTQFLQTPLIQGGIEIQPFNAREVAKRAGVELPTMAKNDALHNVALKTKIKVQGEKLQADDFNLTLDNSTLTGWLHLLNIGKQQLRYELVIDQLNINDYLPPVVAAVPDENIGIESTSSDTAGAAAGTDTMGDEKIELPVEMMRQLDIQGDFRITSLTAKEYDIRNFLMTVKAKAGEIAVKPLSMQVLQGQVVAEANINVQKESPAYVIGLNVDKVQIGPVANPFLEKAMAEKPLKMDGAVNVDMFIKTAGDSLNQLKKASKGQLVLDMKKTRVDGFDPEYYMRKSIADYVHSKGFGLSKTIMGSYTPRDVTVFDKIHSTINIANGKARTDDFLMDSKRVQITAKGHADIMNDTLDVVSGTRLPRGKTAAEKFFDEPLYVRIHGPFTALEYSLDKERLKKSTSGVLKQEAKAKLDAEKQRLKDKAEAEKQRVKEKAKKELKKTTDKYQDKLKNKLKGLF